VPRYEKEDSTTVEPEPVSLNLITGGIRKKGRKGKKGSNKNRYAGLM